MFGGERLAKRAKETLGVNLTFKLFMYVDSANHCRTFAEANWSPRHQGLDIFARNFETGKIHCVACDSDIDMPTQGLDIYCCGFPCGPWSLRGNRLGFSDAASQCVWYAIRTIKYVNPVLYMLENVVNITHSHTGTSGVSDFKVISEFAAAELPHYNSCVLTKICPTFSGYPKKKERVIVLGGRNDQVTQANLTKSCSLVLNNPLPVKVTFRQFIGLDRCQSVVDWSRVGQLPRADELAAISSKGCSCSVDPMQVCEVHPCRCNICQKRGRTWMRCIWRQEALDWIAKHVAGEGGPNDFLNEVRLKSLTYVQVVELAGKAAPSSQRERNLLNLVTLLPKFFPLHATNGVVDVSQGIQHLPMSTDGSLPTAASNASMWSVADGTQLTVSALAKLMGHNIQSFNIKGITEPKMRHMLGHGIHVATAGTCVATLLASLHVAAP